MQHIPLEIICLGMIVDGEGQTHWIGKVVNSHRLSGAQLARRRGAWQRKCGDRIRDAAAGKGKFRGDSAVAAPLRYGKHRLTPANSPRLENP
jgi:hypothetical protein